MRLRIILLVLATSSLILVSFLLPLALLLRTLRGRARDWLARPRRLSGWPRWWRRSSPPDLRLTIAQGERPGSR